MKKKRALSLGILIAMSALIIGQSQSADRLIYGAEQPSIALWKAAYADLLNNLPSVTDYAVNEFALKDLDNNGIPELLVVQSDEDGGVLTVYSNNGSIYRMGDYSDSKVGVSAFVVPDDPKIYGLFNLWWGGGVEHYGYLSVQQEELTYEELYDIDRTGETPRKIDISDNKALINEAVKDFLETDKNGGHILDTYLINEKNIREILDN